MLGKEKKKDIENSDYEVTPLNNETVTKLIAIICIFLVMIIFIFTSGNGSENVTKYYKKISIADLTTIFDKIDNNYSLDIEERINNNLYELTFETDGRFLLYEGDILDKEGILVYENKPFYLISATKEIKPYKGDTSILNDLYYDYSFIKGLIQFCKLEQLDQNKVKCVISNNDYLTKYNEYKHTDVNELDGDIAFVIVYSSSNIESIVADYSKINQAIKNVEDSIEYTIKIRNVGLNDYTPLYDAYKTILQK